MREFEKEMLNKKFKFHSDAGHGWLAVKIDDLRKVGLTVNDFSNFSYVNGSTIYLEEDCDAYKFVQAFEGMFGLIENQIVCLDQKDRSPIRGYTRLDEIRY